MTEDEKMLKLWNSIPPNEPRCMTAYVSRITRNLCLDRYAKLHAEKRGGSQIPAVIEELSPYLPAEGSPEDRLESIAVQEVLTRFLRSPAAGQRAPGCSFPGRSRSEHHRHAAERSV